MLDKYFIESLNQGQITFFTFWGLFSSFQKLDVVYIHLIDSVIEIWTWDMICILEEGMGISVVNI